MYIDNINIDVRTGESARLDQTIVEKSDKHEEICTFCTSYGILVRKLYGISSRTITAEKFFEKKWNLVFKLIQN